MTAPLSMTPARWVVLALGLPVVLAVIGAVSFTAVALADQASYRVHLHVPVSDGQTRVTIDNAAATVRPGAGDEISLNGVLSGSLARPSFSWRSSASGLALHSRCWTWSGQCTLDYDITAPAALPLNVSEGSGNLNVTGFGGRITLADDSGDLLASGLTGTISLSSGSGDINAFGLNGHGVRLSDGSGDISASSVDGDGVRLSDGSGEIVVSGLAATDVVGSDGSGDLTLTFSKVPKQVDVTDESGDITLVLPQGPTRYHVEASTQSGSAFVTVNQARSSPYVIIASSGSGNVTVA
jgi:hypothetical protein